MTSLGRLLFAGGLGYGIVVLSLLQAWAAAASTSALRRYAIAAAAATAALAGPVLLLLGWGQRSHAPSATVVNTVVVLMAFTAAIAFWIGSRFTRSYPADMTIAQRSLRLLPVHGVSLIILGSIDLVLLYAAAMGQLR